MTQPSSSSVIHDLDYHKNQMAKREVETILADLAQERADIIQGTVDHLRQDVRHTKKDRYQQLNKHITETHVEKLSFNINTFIAGAQVLTAFAAAQSPLANFVSGLAKASSAATGFVDSEKQSKLQSLNHFYQDLGGLIQEGIQDIRHKTEEFKQSMQDKAQMLQNIQRLIDMIYSG